MEESHVTELKHKILRALFSSDTLFEYLVLKGGNAVSMIYQLITRASFDLDFSMASDFPGGKEELRSHLESALKEGMRGSEYEVFDIKLLSKPKSLSAEKADFWGGYECTFKLATREIYTNYEHNIENLRRNAVTFGGKSRFFIDISRHEYVASKEMCEVGDIVLFAYTPEMLACEKIRALCQQTEQYKELMKTKTTARSRDFYDIYQLVTFLGLVLVTEENFKIMKAMFEAKRVPIELLGEIKNTRNFHEPDFVSVKDTVLPGIAIEEFGYYFDFVVSLLKDLEAFWNE